MNYPKEEKEKIFQGIKENGYALLKNIFPAQDINNVKKSLCEMLNYIKPDSKITNLQEKYYQIKEYSPELKSHFYDMVQHEIESLRLLRNPKVHNLVKEFFKTEVIFSASPSIHIFDSENERFLEPHQEISQYSKDFLFIWAPLYDAKADQGGLLVFKDSHKKGYQKHHFDNKLGSAQISKEIINQFEKKIVEVEAGSALLIHSSLIHGSIKTKKKRFARFILCDRLCPLVKLPYLKEEKAPIKIPYVGVDYNTIVD